LEWGRHVPLSVKQVLHAKPGRHSDGNGLFLLVKPSGSKSWVLRVQHNGRRRDFGLGSFAAESLDIPVPIQMRKSLTLAQAREKARIGRDLAKAGMNPSALWKVENEAVPTFAYVAEEYHRQVSKAWRNGKHGDQWINTLKAYAYPLIGGVPVDEIDARAIQQVLTSTACRNFDSVDSRGACDFL
jgi:hypothetical protein